MGVEGYASLTSVSPGDWINFHLSADPAGTYTFIVHRAGGIPTFVPSITLKYPDSRADECRPVGARLLLAGGAQFPGPRWASQRPL